MRGCPSILAGQQNRRGSPLARIIGRCRDDPSLLSERRAVGGQQAGAVLKSLLVRLTVFVAQFAPVACCVPSKELVGCWTGWLFDRLAGGLRVLLA
jgi:hypothetical protein